MSSRLDALIRNTYKQYKDDEKSVIITIVEVAKKHRIDVSYLRNGDGSDVSSIAVYHILPLIQKLSLVIPAPRLPNHSIEKLLNVLRGRTKCLEHYARTTDPDDERAQRSNRSHAYPVQILRKVISILDDKGMLGQSNAIRSPHKDDQSISRFNDQDLINPFAVLSIEEATHISDSPEPTSHTHPSQSTSMPSRTEQKSKIEDDPIALWRREEYFFALSCFYEEVNTLRAFLFQQWTQYSLHGSSLTSISFLTNQAIAMVVELEHETLGAFGGRVEWDKFYFSTATRTGQGACTSDFLRMQETIWDCFSAPLDDLVKHSSEIENVLNSIDWFSEESPADRARLETCIAGNIISTFRHWDRETEAGSWLDGKLAQELSFVKIHQDRPDKGPWNIPATTAFAMLMEVTAQSILRDRPNQLLPSSEMSTVTMLDQLCARACAGYEEELKRVKEKKPEHDHYFGNTRAWLLEHGADQMRRENKFQTRLHSDAGLLYRTCWSFTGTAQAMRQFCSAGVHTVTTIQTSTFTILAHLWNLCNQEGALDVQWPDLQFLLNTCGDDLIYRGPRPRKSRRDQYMSRVFYSLGHTQHALLSRRGDHARFDTGLCPHASKFRFAAWPLLHSLCGNVTMTNVFYGMCNNNEELILRATDVQRMLGRPTRRVQMSHLGVDIEDRPEPVKLADSTKRVGPLNVLRLSKQRLELEMKLVEFDWAALNRVCIDLALEIGALFKKNDWSCSMEKFEIMSASLQARAIAIDLSSLVHAQEKKPRAIPKEVVKEQVDGLAAVFKSWIAKHGGVGLRTVATFEPKHLSTLRPTLLSAVEQSVKDYGLLEDVFTPSQRKGLSAFKKTTKLDDVIVETIKGDKTK
ncbi:hypothetical protein PMZ80_001848 [Knufia obscura]|uniref:DUF6604 domain-containing protein n=1 Tax=Knufia obscura TaxID=1635080 RepID=A0ABR0RVN4_9EURO|nr:hypothetical protein PMZ80_001848 [Knufia obscura]